MAFIRELCAFIWTFCRISFCGSRALVSVNGGLLLEDSLLVKM